MKQWFILHVYVGYEKKIKEFIFKEAKLHGLEEFLEEVYIPVRTVSKISKGKRIKREKRVYPGYILLFMELNDALLNLISNAPSVMPFPGIGKSPHPITEEEAQRALGIQKGTAEQEETLFSRGDSVRIIDGAFADFSGVVEEIYSDNERLKIMVTIFGRLTPVELSFFQVEPI
ncbi:transcription termination/antitermination protein NusG [candidate division WOR-3 bacterium]|nr:transcription termination/antitermination protein NusG [candidate division WOR-3 bacterium]